MTPVTMRDLFAAAHSRFLSSPFLPPPTLYLFGGGHVSTAVAKVAGQAGFVIGIVDDRDTFANSERFPMATEIYTSFEDAFEKIHPQLRELIW